jgi:23S rRNA (uracil1939-C5)-methyltransferase
MPLEAAAQEERKRRFVERALGRGLDRFVPSPRALGYRARVSLRPGPDGRLGYTRPGSHEHVAIGGCPAARPEIEEVLGRLGPVPMGVESVELRTDGTRVVCAASGRGGPWAPEGFDEAAWNGRPVRGTAEVVLTVAGIAHRLGPATFYQVNLEANALLVLALREAVLSRKPAGVLDLFSGAGNLSLPLAAAGVPVTLVDSAGPAVDDARRTARRHGLDVLVLRSDALSHKAGERFFDVALLDPPRAGAPGLVAELVLTRPRAIAYVSCNPVALARDLRPALRGGYEVERLEAYDFFPQTEHVEVLCVVGRAG